MRTACARCRYALGRLREIGNRLRKPELAHAMGAWTDLLRAKRERAQMSELQLAQEREQQSADLAERLAAELERERADSAARLAKAEEAKEVALRRQLMELTGSAEEIAAVRPRGASHPPTHTHTHTIVHALLLRQLRRCPDLSC